MNPIYLAATTWQAVLAAGPTPAPTETTVNTSGIMAWIASKILPILLCALGTIFIARASKGEVGKTMTSTGIVILGLALFAGAGLLLGFGTNIVHTIFG